MIRPSIFFPRSLVLLALLAGAASARADGESMASADLTAAVHADYAYSVGITGRGVTVAILDSGIDFGHPEFARPGKLLPGFDATGDNGGAQDFYGHGTHVAGIIGAARDGGGMSGIAYDANLLPVKVLTDDGRGSGAMFDAGLRYAIGKAAIVNMSLGATGSYGAAAMQQAVQGGLLLVVAAGNDGAAEPAWPARFAGAAWANNQIIAVGAVDASNRLASFSNRAGDAAPWFLVAPGEHILSTYPGGGYAWMSGTSMATPVVSAAAALLKQRWPALRADQIANILFVTATDLGMPGIDPVYGRGLLNIEKALQPVGPLVTTSYDGRTIALPAGSVQLSAATTKLWSLASSGRLRLVGLDSFRRDFPVDLGTSVVRPAALSLQQAFAAMDSRIGVAERVLPGGTRVAAGYARTPAPSEDGDGGGRITLASFSLQQQAADGSEFAFGFGGQEARYFGVGGMRMMQGPDLAGVDALADPYFTLAPQAAHVGAARRLGPYKFKFGLLRSGLDAFAGSQDGCLPSSASALPQTRAALFEVSRTYGDAALALGLTQLVESDTYLGTRSSGALSLGNNAATSVVHLAGAVLLAPKLALAGQADYGVTPGAEDLGLVTEVTPARTDAFALALVASDRWRSGDSLSLSLAQPLRTYSGHIGMDMLTGVAADGSPVRERLRFSMVPAGHELRTQLNYRMPFGRQATLALTCMLRREPDNQPDEPTDKLVAIRYMKSF